jgi:hypothetical protein
MRADFARVDEAVFHPLLELRLTNRKKFARTLEIHIAGEIVHALELKRDGISHGANKHLIWNL